MGVLGVLVPVSLDPVVQALGRDPQAACHLRDLVATVCDLANRFNLEFLAISLPTHDHLRYSYIVTLGGVY